MREVVPGFTYYTKHAELRKKFAELNKTLSPRQFEVAAEGQRQHLYIEAGIDCMGHRVRVVDNKTTPWNEFLVSHILPGEGDVCFVFIHKDNVGGEQRFYVRTETVFLVSNSRVSN